MMGIGSACFVQHVLADVSCLQFNTKDYMSKIAEWSTDYLESVDICPDGFGFVELVLDLGMFAPINVSECNWLKWMEFLLNSRHASRIWPNVKAFEEDVDFIAKKTRHARHRAKKCCG